MRSDERRSTALIVIGGLVLWVGWGNALALVNPGGHPCGVRDPAGLHLDSMLQLVYVTPQCDVVFDYAWVVFLSISIVGLSAIIGGIRLVSRERE